MRDLEPTGSFCFHNKFISNSQQDQIQAKAVLKYSFSCLEIRLQRTSIPNGHGFLKIALINEQESCDPAQAAGYYLGLCASLQVDSEAIVLVGDPREVIPDYISKHPVDMVVVGTRGRGKFER
jgi:hypothetical protein